MYHFSHTYLKCNLSSLVERYKFLEYTVSNINSFCEAIIFVDILVYVAEKNQKDTK